MKFLFVAFKNCYFKIDGYKGTSELEGKSWQVIKVVICDTVVCIYSDKYLLIASQ